MPQREWPESGCFALLMLGALLALAAHLDEAASAPASRGPFVLLAVLVVFQIPSLVWSTIHYRRMKAEAVGRITHCRPNLWSVSFGVLRHLPLAFILLVSYEQLWNWEVIGWASGMHWAWSVLAGVATAIGFKYILNRVLRRRRPGLPPEVSPDAFDASLTRSHLPRGCPARTLAHADLVLISPAFEEVAYRGFFVFYFGNLVGASYVGIVAGLLLCVWLHLYLGPSKLASVISFFTVCTLLLYSPFGLLSVIAFHAACNAVYAAALRQKSAQYLDYVRSRRRRGSETARGAKLV